MTKTKSQLRREAVERLKNCVAARFDAESIVIALTSGRHGQSDWSIECDKLIYLLTDDEPQDVTTPEFDVPLYGWHEGDTRGKLEEDVRQYANPEGNTGTLGACWERKMIGFLDRQAAITRAECDKPNWDYCETCEQLKAMQNEIAELKADNDCLRDRNEKLDYEVRDWKGEAKTQRNNFEQATEARKHWQRKYESVKAERDELQERVDNLCASEEIGNKLIIAQLETEAEQGRTIVEYAEKVDELEADRRNWTDGYYLAKLTELEEENRLMRERLRNIADNDLTVFGMKLDEVRNLQAENEQLREKLSRAYDNAHDTLRMMD